MIIEHKTRCWSCGAENELTTHPWEEMVPKNGDISFCFQCGEFAIFDDTLVDGARKPSPSENDEIRSDLTNFILWKAWTRAKRKGR